MSHITICYEADTICYEADTICYEADIICFAADYKMLRSRLQNAS
jgi:hypothetical protein